MIFFEPKILGMIRVLILPLILRIQISIPYNPSIASRSLHGNSGKFPILSAPCGVNGVRQPPKRSSCNIGAEAMEEAPNTVERQRLLPGRAKHFSVDQISITKSIELPTKTANGLEKQPYSKWLFLFDPTFRNGQSYQISAFAARAPHLCVWYRNEFVCFVQVKGGSESLESED